MWNVQLQTFFKMLYVRLINEEAKTVEHVLMTRLVGQYLSCCLRLCGLLYQTFHPTSVSSHLRTHQKRQHVHLCWSPHLYMDQLDILSC